MKDENKPEWGTRMERGKITEISGGKYKVKSYDRTGLTFTELKNRTGVVLEVGDKVVFYAFCDGRGSMIEKI